MKTKEIQKLIKKASAIDRALLEELEKALKELRKSGIKPTEYDILPSYSKGNLHRSTDDSDDVENENS